MFKAEGNERPRSELSEQYDRLMGIVGQVLELNEEERGFVLDRIAPEPEQPKVRRRRKKTTEAGAQKKRGLPPASDGACIYILENGAVCNTGDNNPIHDKSMGYAGYHPFVSVTSTTAPSATRKSSRRTKPSEAEPLSIVNSETDTEGVSVAAGAGD